METKYYIYHIPSVKIGVSTKPDKRVAKQGYSDYEILETHTCIMKVSEREQELQMQYGYKVDRTSYHLICKRAINAGLSTPKSQLSEMGKKSKPTSEQMHKINKQKRILTFKDAEKIRELYAQKSYTTYRLGKMFDVNHTSINLIIQNKTYITP
jgi:hypothetical protein